jgi:diguanylate cyclase (GGDEF)-like protein/PAS domain S-box-containing protein
MDNEQNQQGFLREVVGQLYLNNSATILIGSVLACLLTLTLWELASHVQLLLWLVLIEAVYAARFLLIRAYFRSASRDSSVWLFRFRAGVALQGILWGTATVLFIPPNNTITQDVFMLGFCGLAAGGAIAFGIDAISVLWFEVPLTVPLLAHFLVQGTLESVVMGTMVLMYIGYIGISLRRSSRAMHENISLKLAAATREEEIRSQHALLNTILESEPECVKVVAPNGRLVQMNGAGLAMLEVDSVEEANRTGLLNFVHPDHRDAFQRLFNSACKGEHGHLEFQVTGKHGTQLWLETSAAPLRNADGEITGMLGVTRNITGHKQAETQIRESRQLLDNIVENLPNMIFLKDAADLRFRMLNHAAEKLLGRDRTEMIGKNDRDFFPPEQADFFTRNDRAVLEGDRVLDIAEEAIQTPDGLRILHTQKIALRDEQGKPLYLLGISEDITERKQHERALRESEEKLRGLYELAPVGIALTDMNGRYVEFNEAFRAICGYSAEELKKLDYWELTPIKYEADEARMLEALKNTGHYGPYEKEYIHKSGALIPLRLNGMLVSGQDGKQYIWSIVEDISESRQAEREVRIAATAFESQEGMIITDEHANILRVNKAFTDISGYTSAEVIGRNPRLLSSGRHDQRFYEAMWRSINSTGSWVGEIWNRRKDGGVFPEHLTITSVKDAAGKVINYVGSLTDITQRKQSEEEIQRLAFYDHLTLLPNRRLFMDRLRQSIASGIRNQRTGALLFIDMDNFKNLNDTLGHDYGDLLLQQIAGRLKDCVREGDTVARLGGDEFVILLEDMSGSLDDAVPQVEAIGRKVLEALGQPYNLNGTRYSSTPSIGVTLVKDQQIAADDFLKQADIAMYQAKKAGRNTLRFFDQEMQEAINRRAALESDLRNALERDQIRLYYQVQKTSQDKVVGAEALIRWAHPERGMVSPAVFVPLAEETGLILPIGKKVIEMACAQLKKWDQDARTRNLTIAVNVSAKQFHQPGFAGLVEQAIGRHDINPSRLKLELTESLLLHNIEETVQTMSALNLVGVQISLDDFGTGYSSLQYLKRLPLDQLKIDQSFVRDIAEIGGHLAIVQTIIAMADSMGLDIIAEGVETEKQRKLLLKSGCTHFQGYLFGKPMPIEQFEAALD